MDLVRIFDLCKPHLYLTNYEIFAGVLPTFIGEHFGIAILLRRYYL